MQKNVNIYLSKTEKVSSDLMLDSKEKKVLCFSLKCMYISSFSWSCEKILSWSNERSCNNEVKIIKEIWENSIIK